MKTLQFAKTSAICATIATLGAIVGYMSAPQTSLPLSEKSDAAIKTSPPSRKPIDDSTQNRTMDPSELDMPIEEPPVARVPHASMGRLGSAAQMEALHEALIELAKTDPLSALEFAQSHLKYRRQEMLMCSVLDEWAKHDPVGAWEWATKAADPNVNFIDAVLNKLSQSHPETAWDWAREFSEKSPELMRPTYVGALRGMLHSGQFQTAASYMQQDEALPQEGRAPVMAYIAKQWGLYNPDQALEWVESMPEGQVQEEMRLEVSHALINLDPEKAAKYAAQLPAGNTQQNALESSVVQWLQDDPVAVGDWMNTLELTPALDKSIMQFTIHPSVIQDTETALSWAESISDTEVKTQTLTILMSDLLDRDPEAVTAYLYEPSDLPESIQKDIIERIESNDLYGN